MPYIFNSVPFSAKFMSVLNDTETFYTSSPFLDLLQFSLSGLSGPPFYQRVIRCCCFELEKASSSRGIVSLIRGFSCPTLILSTETFGQFGLGLASVGVSQTTEQESFAVFTLFVPETMLSSIGWPVAHFLRRSSSV